MCFVDLAKEYDRDPQYSVGGTAEASGEGGTLEGHQITLQPKSFVWALCTKLSCFLWVLASARAVLCHQFFSVLHHWIFAAEHNNSRMRISSSKSVAIGLCWISYSRRGKIGFKSLCK